MEQYIKKVVIVGGGFAGVNLIKKLTNDPRFQVTLVDKNNYHFFPPLLYQVSTAFIENSNISYPFRRMFQHRRNIRFHIGSLIKVNSEENTIETDTGILPYDYLVLSLGTETNYFGMENVKQNALSMKTIRDALKLRDHLLLNMEKAVRAVNKFEKTKYFNIVIAGGGPTGVEIAGMLAEMVHSIGAKDYPEITDRKVNIILIDASPSLLGPMSKKSQEEAANVLTKLGVQIKLNTPVKDYKDGKVLLGNGETIPTNSLIWTSGVIACEVKGLAPEAIGRGRRIIVDEYNTVHSTQNVFAIGDICLQTSDEHYPGGHPQLAQVAIQQGDLLGENLKKMVENKPLRAFHYKNKGSMAIIAKYKAVVDLPKGFFKGFFAWLVWLFIHLIPIASFRNKFTLMFNWFFAFATNDPTLRLIISKEKKKGEEVKKELT
ncbi:NAD(P)/FAD-dependent oxidoreductase [Albibacterium bauzanense]|uniref:NADH:ubiquinone reductase (non-electrogenic) n=1 Tax=Albibacterium bauzanense TaxID=653929 RepID=A0A4R1M0Q7_9SPHI|nr:NAD(P)/FAD-dependent oxidoreductase [Albibacterium bauzanense]TCK85496.1 NADH dehydrogenase [Albibacterium bauzanense]